MPCSRQVGEVGVCSAFDNQGGCGLAVYVRYKGVRGRVRVCILVEYFLNANKIVSGVVDERDRAPHIAGGWRKRVE